MCSRHQYTASGPNPTGPNVRSWTVPATEGRGDRRRSPSVRGASCEATLRARRRSQHRSEPRCARSGDLRTRRGRTPAASAERSPRSSALPRRWTVCSAAGVCARGHGPPSRAFHPEDEASDVGGGWRTTLFASSADIDRADIGIVASPRLHGTRCDARRRPGRLPGPPPNRPFQRSSVRRCAPKASCSRARPRPRRATCRCWILLAEPPLPKRPPR
jgi:hypothetical protein